MSSHNLLQEHKYWSVGFSENSLFFAAPLPPGRGISVCSPPEPTLDQCAPTTTPHRGRGRRRCWCPLPISLPIATCWAAVSPQPSLFWSRSKPPNPSGLLRPGTKLSARLARVLAPSSASIAGGWVDAPGPLLRVEKSLISLENF